MLITDQVVTAMSGADNECRPLGYKAFVYFGDNYAGAHSKKPLSDRWRQG